MLEPRRCEFCSPLDSVATAFRLLCVEPSSLAVDGARVGHDLPPRKIPLPELKALLLHPSTGHGVRDAVWRELIRRSRVDGPAWVVGATGVALPGLRRVAGRLAGGYHGDTADLDAEVLAGFLLALRTLDVERPRIALRLCRAAYRAGLAARYADAQSWEPHVDPVSSVPPPRPWGHPDLVLANAVRKGVLAAEEAELIGRTRLERVPLTAVAAEAGIDYATLAQRRWRAERRLLRAIQSGDVGSAVSNLAA